MKRVFPITEKKKSSLNFEGLSSPDGLVNRVFPLALSKNLVTHVAARSLKGELAGRRARAGRDRPVPSFQIQTRLEPL